jgi:hypothetical protein
VIALLADVNVDGQVARLIALMRGDYWREVFEHLDIRALTFQDVGLAVTTSDAKVWQFCQRQQFYLLTNNRNDDGPDSLQATIQAHNTARNLPVFTFSDGNRILKNKDYAQRVVESLLDHLLRIDEFHGAGRLYLP